MNCHRPAAPTGELALGTKELSTTGRKASSVGMPRFSTSFMMWNRYLRLRSRVRRRYSGRAV
ncbi:hypothetical protein D3C85_1458460 [compost metagenome]